MLNLIDYKIKDISLSRRTPNKAEDFSYQLYIVSTGSKKAVAILGYNGTRRYIVMPETIEGYPVKKICNEAFMNLNGTGGTTPIKSIILPKSLSDIQARIFKNCTELVSIVFKSQYISTAQAAEIFYNTASLKNIVFPPIKTANSAMGTRVFSCSGIERFVIPENYRTIKAGAFYNCPNLSEVVFNPEVKALASHTFFNCPSLLSVTIAEDCEYRKTTSPTFDPHVIVNYF